MTVTIYHNPACGTSRNVLGLIRDSGEDRPIVVTPLGIKLCCPSEAVLGVLQNPRRGRFVKEDGEAIVDEDGNRIARAMG